MKKLFILLSFLQFLIVQTSCNNDFEESSTIKNNEVSFTLLKTKAGDTNFSIGDEIGVYAVYSAQTLQSSGNYADNKRFRWNGSAFIPVDNSNRIFTAPGVTLDYYTYYPYNSSLNSATNSNFNISTDQSSNITSSDLMTAVFKGAGFNTIIPLTFRHLMTTTEITFHKGSNSVTSAKLTGRNIAAQNVNLADGSYNTASSASNITLYKTSETSDVITYRALIPKQSISIGTPIFSFVVNGSLTRSYIANENLNLTAGSKNTYNVYLAYKIIASAGVGGTVSGTGNFNIGSTCNLVATPNSGYKLSGWFEGGTLVSSNSTYSFIPMNDRSLTAMFAVNETYETSYTVSLSPTSFNFVATGGSQSFTISCNRIVKTYVNGTLTNTASTASTDYSLSVSGTGFSVSGNQVIAADNSSTSSRMGTLTVTAGTASASADLLQDGKVSVDVGIIN
jgi:hypothetical protein